MSESLNHIDILIGKCVSGNATQDELQELEQWKSESKNNLSVFQAATKAWSNSQNIISEKELHNDRNDVMADILTKQSAQIRSHRLVSRWLKIAAIIVLPIFLAGSWSLIQNFSGAGLVDQYCEICSSHGNVSKCTLPDGTEVWINADSKVSYNAASFNKADREVKIDGEAYFEVTKNKRKPFRVATSVASILVTGTSFNVKAYSEDGTFESVLTEGSIEMKLNSENAQTIRMKPGERAVFDGVQGIKISTVNPKKYSSWRTGELFFDDATLNDLLKELSRIYNVKFHLEDKTLGESRFRGMFSYDSNLIDALDKIKDTSGLNYSLRNSEVWITKE